MLTPLHVPKLHWGYDAVLLLFSATAVTAFVLSIMAYTDEPSDTKNISTTGTTTNFSGNIETKENVQASQMILTSSEGPNAKTGTQSVIANTGVLYVDANAVLHFQNSSSDNRIAPRTDFVVSTLSGEANSLNTMEFTDTGVNFTVGSFLVNGTTIPVGGDAFVARDGSLAMTGNLDMGSNSIVDVTAIDAKGALNLGTGTATTSSILGKNSAITTIKGSSLNIGTNATTSIGIGNTSSTMSITGSTVSYNGIEAVNIGTSSTSTVTLGGIILNTMSITGATANYDAKTTVNVGTSATTSTILGNTSGSTTISGVASIGTTSNGRVIFGNDVIATGTDQIAIGTSASAGSQNTSIAIGVASIAEGIAIGPSAHSQAADSISIGKNAVGDEHDGICIGKNAIQNGTGIVIGNDAKLDPSVSTADNGVVIGFGASAKQDYSVAIGYSASIDILGPPPTSNGSAVAVGALSSVSQENSVAIGTLAHATGINSIVIGHNTTNATDNSCVLGNTAMTNLRPSADDTCDLGVASTNRFKDLHLSRGVHASSLDFAGALSIGTTSATSTTIGRSGVSTSITGSTIGVGTSSATSITVGNTSASLTLTGSTVSFNGTGAVTIGTSATSTVTIGGTNATTTSIDGKTMNVGTSVATMTNIGHTGSTTAILGSSINVTGNLIPTVSTTDIGASSGPFARVFTNLLKMPNTGLAPAVGTATLSGGSATVSTTSTATAAQIFLTYHTTNSAPTNTGTLFVQDNEISDSQFIIRSTNGSDANPVSWLIVNTF